MAAHEVRSHAPARSLPRTVQVILVVVLCAVASVVVFHGRARSAHNASSSPANEVRGTRPFVPTAGQLATFTIRDVEERSFQVEHATEGKVSVDEDRTTPIFTQYSGRVIRLVARQGDVVRQGQVLFTIEAADMVQAQNDLLATNGAVNKARSQLQLQQIIEKRQHDLFDSKAVSLKEWQTAQNDLVSAQNDLRGAEGGVEAVRNRLAILGRSEAEVKAFLAGGKMSAETPIYSPIAGTVTQRKIGPGQYLSGGAGDPAYTIGDRSSVWADRECPRERGVRASRSARRSSFGSWLSRTAPSTRA